MFKTYYRLTKPGIIYGNLLTAVGGFLLASRGNINFGLLAAMALGTSLIIASACVFNNYIDRDIDALMARTKKRALAAAEIEEEYALIFAGVLGMLGVFVLGATTNTLTLFIGLLGFMSYVFAYTYAKRRTVHATLIGTIPGATAIVAGYTAVLDRLDLGAALLFLAMIIWQLPHFYAIAMFRRDEYAAAHIPVLSVVKGMRISKIYITSGIGAFSIAACAVALYGYASFSYFIIMACTGLYWLFIALSNIRKGIEDVRWARKVFGASLLVLLIFSITLSLDTWLL